MVCVQEAADRRRKRDAASCIQAQWRLHCERETALTRMHTARATRNTTFAALQDRLRAEWPAFNRGHRTIVHVPSLCVAPRVRSSIAADSSSALLEATQLSRICDVADPCVDVIYISSAPVDGEVQQYWAKLLEAGGVAEAASRFRCVHPENAARLPERLPLTAKLLASPRAMQRIKAMLQGRPAFIVPGIVGDADVDLAVALAVPMLSSHPSVAATVATKSGARAVFKRARMNVPPGRVLPPAGQVASRSSGDMDLSFQLKAGQLLVEAAAGPSGAEAGGAGDRKQARKDSDLCHALAQAIVAHPSVAVRLCPSAAACDCPDQSDSAHEVQRWLVKLEDEDTGRGLAYLDCARVHGLSDELANVLDTLAGLVATPPSSSSPPAWPDTSKMSISRAAPFEELRAQGELIVGRLLLARLSKALVVANGKVFPSYRAFVQVRSFLLSSSRLLEFLLFLPAIKCRRCRKRTASS